MLVLNQSHPARTELQSHTAIIDPERAAHAEIRALRLGVLNLMPVMDETEKDILRCISHSVLQIEPIWIRIASREPSGRSTPKEHIDTFYQTMAEATREKPLDGLIITGAPIEKLAFEEVEYWGELMQIMSYSRQNVLSTMYLCWAAMAGAYHFYQVEKISYPEKLAGLFTMRNVQGDENPLTRGMNPQVQICQSRYTGVDLEALKAYIDEGHLVSLFESDDPAEVLGKKAIGVTAWASSDLREVYNLGHLEYHARTIDQEVRRDLAKDLHYPVEHYYRDPLQRAGIPALAWKSDRTLFFGNFLTAIYERLNQNPSRTWEPFLLDLERA